MKKKKLALLIIFCLLLSFFALRAVGIVDVNLYKSMLSCSHSITKSTVNPSQEKQFSYQVILKHGDKILENYSRSYNNHPPIKIEAILDDPIYSGNYSLPLVKNFKMTYLCTFTTTESSDGHEVEGKIKGKVEGEIQGFCSCKKAKELAFEEAKKEITSYLHKLN
ncbi:MAG: hypothetical protein ACYSUT_08440 [Planctomycetota bacterium]|jgi:hypothetical protein